MMEMIVPVTHAQVVVPVLMNFSVLCAFVWMEQLVTDVNVSNHWLCCSF